MRGLRILLIVPLLLLANGSATAAPPAVEAVLHNHCIACHGADTQKGGLRLDTLSRDLSTREALGLWTKVYDRVAANEMPPKKHVQPTAAERTALVDWLKTSLHESSLARQKSEGRVVVRRLNRIEYENTLRDLLGVHVDEIGRAHV